MKNILFIRPSLVGRNENIGIPLGIMLISSVLKKNNIETKIIDCTIEKNLDIKNIIRKFSPDAVGISTQYNLQIENAFKIAKSIRKIDKNITLVTGGNPATVMPDRFLDFFDIVVRGEGEFTSLEIFQNKKLKDIKGISYKKGNKKIHNSNRRWISNLDVLPFPDYESINMENYFNSFERIDFFENISGRKIPMITSRGCPFGCSFCSINLHMGKIWRPHSTEYILRHLEFVTSNYNIEHVNFEDDNMTLNTKRFEDILDGIKKRYINITWDTPNGIRLDTLNRRLLKKMKSCGVKRLTVGIESGSQRVLDDIIHKNIKLKDAVRIAKMCKEEKVSLSAFYIIGMPGETKKDIEKTLDFAFMLLKKYNVIPKISIASLLPGTEMTRLCEKNNYLKEGRVETEEFKVEDIDRYYKNFTKKLIIPYLRRINLITVAKNIDKFPRMAIRNFKTKNSLKV